MTRKYPIEFSVIESSKLVNIKFNQNKFATKDLGLFAHLFYSYIKNNRTFKFHFYLSNLGWIAHEELVYLSGLFDQLYRNKILFKIHLRNNDPSYRQIKTILYLWESWQIFTFIPHYRIKSEISKYFDIDNNYIAQLYKKLEELEKEVDDNHYNKITPFVKLEFSRGQLNEKNLVNNLNKIYKLDKKTYQLLEDHSSDTPFLNRTLSSIITKELYENSIEHAFNNKRIKNPTCYLAVSLRKKLEEDEYSLSTYINGLKAKNFREEEIPESESFFNGSSGYKNQTLIHFTFLDFGEGIPNTLGTMLNKPNEKADTEILQYAFEYTSSRHPLGKRYLEKNFIPRGLYDVISIVKRYKGLLIVRSNYGKILYDFSIDENISQCSVKYEQEKKYFFNGTIITILIPENNFGIETKKIKAQYLTKVAKKENLYLNILEFQKEAIKEISLKNGKESLIKDLYNATLDKIGAFLDSIQNRECCVYIDFDGFFNESKLTKKILFFFASDYRINEKTSAIIANLNDKELIIQVQLEILSSPNEKKRFLYHPIPCIIRNGTDFDIIWLGVDNPDTAENLNQVLSSEIHDRRLSDFDHEAEITDTGIINLDEYGNLKTIIGTLRDQSIHQLISKSTLKDENAVYLCSGNYYQFEYIALLEALYDFDYANYIVGLLYEDVIMRNPNYFDDVTHIVAITLSSQIIAKSFLQFDNARSIRNNTDEKLKNVQLLRLSNYHSYHLESDFINKLKEGEKIVLVCDVISTGYLVKSLKTKLDKLSIEFKSVLAIADTREQSPSGDIRSYFEESVDTFVLDRRPVKKYSAKEIPFLNSKKLVRINPATNTPITLGENKSEVQETVLFKPEDFFSLFEKPESYLQIGFYRYNKLFHPYFFKTHSIFESKSGRSLLEEMLDRIYGDNEIEIDFVFYPIFSGAEVFHSEEYLENVFAKYDCEFIPLARFNTPLGWRFTFPPKFLNNKTLNSDVFILDDGSCTGSTIIQMVDEISFLDIRSITLLSVVGRTDVFLREFFSRIKKIKVKYLSGQLTQIFNTKENKDNGNRIPINIYFGTHFHIPAYPIFSNYPFIDEEARLENYSNFDNLPDILSKYIIYRLDKIRLKHADEDNSTSHASYLPKDSNNNIPMVDLFLMRNEIGKINGYRFYTDYFEFFDKYTKFFYENKDKDFIYKQTELLLAVVLHEPYLIRAIQDFLPDVYSCLLRFTDDLLNCNEGNDESFKYEELSYKWSKSNIVSIYLNLRKDKVNSVLSPNKLHSLLSFISTDEKLNSLIIFFMYILNYVPITKSELVKQEDGIFCLKELTNYVNREDIKIKHRVYTNLKLFKSFLNTIPYLDKDLVSKKACLYKMVQFYNEEKSIKNHDSSIERQLGIIKTQSNLIPLSEDLFSNESKSAEIIKAWKTILPRLEQYQRYTSRVIGFFDVYKNGTISQDLYRSDSNLLKIVHDISEIIENKLIVEKSSIIHEYTKNKLLANFFSEDAFIYKLFLNFETKNIVSIWDESMQKIKKFHIENQKVIDEVNNLTIDFPLLYLKEVVFKEIRRNFRYSDINDVIKVDWIINDNILELVIKNKIGEAGRKGGNNGEETFDLLSRILNFEYSFQKVPDGYFTQKFKFMVK